MGYAIRICSCAPPPMAPPMLTTARDYYYAERRLQRIEKHLEASRGETLNLEWMHWIGEWTTLHDAICGAVDACRHTKR